VQFSDKSIARFWARVTKAGDDDCWLWTGNMIQGGYGIMWADTHRLVATHIALELDGRRRPPPPRHFALHGDCTNPACVNPRHLRWGTQKENMADCKRLGRLFRMAGARHSRAMPNTPETRARKLQIFAWPGRLAEVSGELGLSVGMVRDIRAGRRWAHIPLEVPDELKVWLVEQAERDVRAGARSIPGFDVTEARVAV
jgi:hypothetical protein